MEKRINFTNIENWKLILGTIEPTNNRVKDQLKNMGLCRYTYLSEKEQAALETLKHGEDTVVTKADKGGTATENNKI